MKTTFLSESLLLIAVVLMWLAVFGLFTGMTNEVKTLILSYSTAAFAIETVLIRRMNGKL